MAVRNTGYATAAPVIQTAVWLRGRPAAADKSQTCPYGRTDAPVRDVGIVVNNLTNPALLL